MGEGPSLWRRDDPDVLGIVAGDHPEVGGRVRGVRIAVDDDDARPLEQAMGLASRDDTADTAAVRASVMKRPSSSACNAPVSGSSRRIDARWLGSPRASLLPTTVTSLAPSPGCALVEARTNAGMRPKNA